MEVTGDYYVKGPMTVMNEYEEERRKEEEGIRKVEEDMRNALVGKEVQAEEEDEVTINTDSEDLFKLPGVECIIISFNLICKMITSKKILASRTIVKKKTTGDLNNNHLLL